MAIREAGVRLTLQGEAGYRAGIKGISQEMRTLATESKLAIAQLGNNASITDTYSTKMKSMGNEIQMASRQTEVLKNRQSDLPRVQKEISSALDDTNKAYKESAKETERLKNNYELMRKALGRNHEETIKAKEAYETSKKATSDLKREHKDLSSELNRTEKELAKLPNELAKAELATQELRNETQRLHEEYRNAGGRLADTSKQWRDVGNSMITVGGQMSQAGDWMTTRFTLPIVAGFGAAIKTGLNFDQQMRQTAAIAGLTAEDLTTAGGAYEQLREQAIQLGADSIFGATDVSVAQEMMASAGLEVTEILGAIPGVMDLAAVSGKDMALASQAVATAMNQFGLEATDATHVADVFARAAADTNAETNDMAEALKFAGNVLGPMGIQFEEAAAAIGIMSNAGITGSLAGTALRGAFTRLANPTKQVSGAMEELGWSAYDAEGNMKPLSQMIPELRDSLKGLTNEQRDQYLASIFGTNALSGMLALVNSAPGELEALTASLENSEGAAQSMAEVINSGANGAIEELMGAVETLSIELFDTLAPSLISIVEGITGAVEAFSDLDEGTQKSIIQGALFVAAAGPIVSVLGRITTGTGHVVTGVGKAIKAFGKWTTPKGIADTATELGKIPGAATSAGAGATLFSNPWVIAGGVAIGAVAGFVAYMNHEANKPFKAHNEAVTETEGAYQTWFDAMMEGQSAIEAFNDSAQDNAKESTNAYNELADEIRNTNLEITELINTQTEKSEPFLGSLAQNIEVNGQRVSIVVESLIDQMRDLGRTDEEIEAVTDAYSNYGNMLTNSFTRIADDFQNNTAMTEKWASAHIQTVKDVAQSTVERYEEMRQAELDANAQRRENLNETEAWLTQQNSITNAKYDEQVQIVNNAFSTIQGILANAKDETGNWRQLTEKEVVSLLQAYQNLAEGTGQSLHEMDEVGQLIGSNMSAMVTTMGLDFLMSAGLIDQATMEMIASAGTAEEKIALLSEALGDYDTIQIEGKDIFVNTDEAQTEIQALIDAGTEWNGFTPEQKMFMMQTMGGEAVKYLLDTIGIDWNTLTPEQKELIANVQNAEDVENVVHEIGNWNNLSIEDKILNLEAQVANDQILSIIQSRDLWNQGTFYEEFIAIDTNAPDAEQKILELINRTLEVMGMPPLQIATETNADESAEKVEAYGSAVGAVPVQTESTFTAGVGGVSEATGIASDWKGTVDGVPESKTSGIKTNVFSTIANTLAITLYNAAVGAMTDKSVEASTSTPSMLANTLLITGYNSASGKMKDTQATATTRTPNLPRHTNLVKDWNSAMRAMFNKTSTATTRTPNIASNTSSVWSWINALNSAYNRTSTLTTNRVTRYSTIGISPRGYKDGGHIDAYADGGNIKWGGMFANGGNVPQGYMGIVGEAGPELFHVTKSGVSITPLASNEKMEGVEGAIGRYMEGKGGGGGDSYAIDINISDVTIRDDRDIDKLTDSISERLVKQMQRDKKMRKGSVVGFG